jgi:uncharacterized glyoxalase superfamily protein PhnB
MQFKLPAAVPEIPVGDLHRAIGYYRDNLGFTIDWSSDELGLAGISNGDCRIFLADPAFRKQRGTSAPVLIWLNLSSKADVDELHRVWSASDAKLLSAPESKPWGLHEFTATDPDGNFLRVFYDFGTAG